MASAHMKRQDQFMRDEQSSIKNIFHKAGVKSKSGKCLMEQDYEEAPYHRHGCETINTFSPKSVSMRSLPLM